MISNEKRIAVKSLFEAGKRVQEIARDLHVNAKTIRKILAQGVQKGALNRKDKKTVDEDLLRKLYESCQGYLQRIYEKLTEEYQIKIGYSTLTRLIREMGIGLEKIQRSPHVEVFPGEEMQHDTSSYWVKIGDKTVKVIASGLYFRYSKIRYVKFYPYFNRFRMKCFFYEALTFWGYTAKHCVIDNTNLAVLHGTGHNAVFNPEMVVFAKIFGFEWFAHELGHANRKAGKERNFYTLETNFFPGRSFSSWKNLNQQALQWATERYAKRPHSQTKLIPLELFEIEKKHLIALPSFIEPPYQEHQRKIDAYGYIAFQGNYYWIPETTAKEIKLLEYSQKIKIFHNRDYPLEYSLSFEEAKNQFFSPENIKKPAQQPSSLKKNSQEEEKKLRLKGKILQDYLDWIHLSKEISMKHKFIRNLYALSLKWAPSLLNQIIARALEYQVTSIDTLKKMALQIIKISAHEMSTLFDQAILDKNQDNLNQENQQNDESAN